MSPEERELLNRSVALAEDNNKMLHSMRRSMRFQRVMTALYWVFIIGSFVGAYYFVEPYLDQLRNVYGGAQSDLKDVGSIIDNLKKQYGE